jgi:hypothetical protein
MLALKSAKGPVRKDTVIPLKKPEAFAKASLTAMFKLCAPDCILQASGHVEIKANFLS